MPPEDHKFKSLEEAKILKELEKKYKEMVDAESALTDDEEIILEHLGSFIKYNKKLLQLDMSHTGIKVNLLRELVSCLSKTKSLLVT